MYKNKEMIKNVHYWLVFYDIISSIPPVNIGVTNFLLFYIKEVYKNEQHN
jgi:hypothetical protein